MFAIKTPVAIDRSIASLDHVQEDVGLREHAWMAGAA
jgi:hypothetical protein